jgi:hypothetical protein
MLSQHNERSIRIVAFGAEVLALFALKISCIKIHLLYRQNQFSTMTKYKACDIQFPHRGEGLCPYKSL